MMKLYFIKIIYFWLNLLSTSSLLYKMNQSKYKIRISIQKVVIEIQVTYEKYDKP